VNAGRTSLIVSVANALAAKESQFECLHAQPGYRCLPSLPAKIPLGFRIPERQSSPLISASTSFASVAIFLPPKSTQIVKFPPRQALKTKLCRSRYRGPFSFPVIWKKKKGLWRRCAHTL
jgi:hypothetical protein